MKVWLWWELWDALNCRLLLQSPKSGHSREKQELQITRDPVVEFCLVSCTQEEKLDWTCFKENTLLYKEPTKRLEYYFKTGLSALTRFVMVSYLEVVYWVTVLCCLGQKHLVIAGCSGKCCRGRNMGCSTTDWRMDRAFAKCYCDEVCIKTKDCCFDYFTECPAQDCAVSAWSFWSGCAKPCQPSVRVRVRPVEQQPGNSGDPCPSLEERAGCREYRDHRGSQCGLNSGPAFITSLEFGKGRPKHDSYGNPLDPGFCMEFKMESRTAHCTVENRPHTLWMRYITEGFKVCVACEPPALQNSSCQGDGQESNKEAVLQWQAVGNPHCRGTWRKVQKTPQCTCPTQHIFIFT